MRARRTLGVRTGRLHMDEKRRKLRAMRLYALLTEERCRRPWRWTARELLEGGVDVLQLREKTLDDRVLLERAGELKELTAAYGALFIVNDRPDVALLCCADGVHLGQDDLPPEGVRHLVGEELLIGLSTHSVEQARAAQSRGADYVGVGPVFPTNTKGYQRGGGTALVAELCAATDLPTVAIGGITLERAAGVIEAGATAVAACQALCGAADPRGTAREFLRISDQWLDRPRSY